MQQQQEDQEPNNNNNPNTIPRVEEKKDDDDNDNADDAVGDLPKPKTPNHHQSLRAEKLRLAPGSDRNLVSTRLSFATSGNSSSMTPEKAEKAGATRLSSMSPSERLRMAPGSVRMDGNGSVEMLTTPEKPSLSLAANGESLRLAPGAAAVTRLTMGNGNKRADPDIEVSPASVPNQFTQHGAVRVGNSSNSSSSNILYNDDIIKVTNDIENNLVEAEVVVNEVENMQEELQRLRGSLEAMREEQRRNQEFQMNQQQQQQQQRSMVEEPKVVVVAVEESNGDGCCNKTCWIVVVVLLIIAGGVAGVFLSGVTDSKNEGTATSATSTTTPADSKVPPTLVVTAAPTSDPTPFPTRAPIPAPIPAPTKSPTLFPTLAPVPAPTQSPTRAPVPAPTLAPTSAAPIPTSRPTPAPTNSPTLYPTPNPTDRPTPGPTNPPTFMPTPNPTTPTPTLLPTQMPTLHPTQATLELLLQDYAPLNVQAITWLQTSTWQPPEGQDASEAAYQMLERYALASLYFSTTTNGSNGNISDWNQSDNWLSTSEPVCKWFSRDTIDATNNDCDEGQPLRRLNLASNGLQGSIPRVLFGLTALTYLDLSSNQLTGQIPDTLGNLVNLQELQLESNQLSGPIPESILELQNLEWLYLQDNQLSGIVPSLPFIDFGCYLDGNCFIIGDDTSANVDLSSSSCRMIQNNCT